MRIIVIWILTSLFFSCQSDEKRMEKNIQKEWRGKKIAFPTTLEAKFLGEDTTCNDLLNKCYSILVYVDSNECSECRLQLYEWYKKITETRAYSDSLAFLFVAHVENPKQVVILSKQNNFRYPIFFDKKGMMGKLNKFPDSYQFKTFLLNEKKEVVLMGTPIGNDELWRLYKEVIISGIKGK
ncbi:MULTISPECIES: hypothetical protein [Sanguibacteroides]|uniref:Alkyl hydroperoxide reductase subunit C/ Thiol specific antioxidant domain-containing protein n=2 Tax=Sanguibacteroides justesenii TaxID=1547597 RepID=A0AB34R7Y4_9PORP|nr:MULTISPECIES: hypothetical protein [Sanguibacteroides]KIO47121.1 hypothetical protein IE90_00510 [Sanguibacteroides justesenii]PXZ42650.1 hypothetical protein DMB45_14455 [Sanguibacteroides justesenii]